MAVEVSWSLKHDLGPLPDASSTCLHVDQVRIQIGYKRATVTIRADVDADPCRRAIALSHEQDHIQAAVASVNEAVPHIRATLSAAVHQVAIVASPSADKAEAVVAQIIDAVLQSEIALLLKTGEARQREIDSPAALAALAAICGRP